MSRDPSQTAADALPYDQLPPHYHRWKWRVLLAFAGFYLFLYMGRFNLWPTAPLVKQDLGIDHQTIGWINALLLWGFMLGDLVHGRLAELYGLRLWVMLVVIWLPPRDDPTLSQALSPTKTIK